MKTKIEKLKNYLDLLSKDTGWHIIIEDFYSVLRPYEIIGEYLSDKKWHTNPYCMKIKKNPRLWKRCVALKRATRRSERKRGCAGFSVCYCGVAEYTIPIFISGVHIGTVCAAGFFSPLSRKMTEILAKHTESGVEEFEKFRQAHLREADEATVSRLKSYLGVVADMIIDIVGNTPLMRPTSNKNAPDNRRKYFLMAMDHIDKHCCENITPLSVAKRVNVSLSYLQHLFIEFSSDGIAGAIRRKRIERACRYLIETDRSIKDIAFSCGFYNTDYFSVAFKKSTGTSPLKFRKLHICDLEPDEGDL
ncbi:MAG: helix-turn-helix domain-containing protein [Ruminococcaceae bacterium]|nr:helix-turn-helix domain-containing protein [Oscillospiraceae bacterium]